MKINTCTLGLKERLMWLAPLRQTKSKNLINVYVSLYVRDAYACMCACVCVCVCGLALIVTASMGGREWQLHWDEMNGQQLLRFVLFCLFFCIIICSDVLSID